MWWPAIGGIFVGIGGLIFPQALGVGYDTIGLLLKGNTPLTFLLGVLLVKSAIWMISLGSGTSGGVLAPLLMMGAALGGIGGMFLPHFGEGFWPLVAMGAILGGTMRSPFTGIVFAIELTHDLNMLLPLLVANFLAHGFTVLVLKRSILTEKISRRGYHLSREYAVDALEILFVREVMRTNIVALPANATLEEIRELLRPAKRPHGQNVFPAVDENQRIVGVISRNDLLKRMEDPGSKPLTDRLADVVSHNVTVAYTDEPLRVVVYRMAETGYTRMPVVDSEDQRRLLGMISLEDLLRARTRHLEEERHRERLLRIRLPLRRRGGNPPAKPRAPALYSVGVIAANELKS
jgi:CBS domain-containing protein